MLLLPCFDANPADGLFQILKRNRSNAAVVLRLLAETSLLAIGDFRSITMRQYLQKQRGMHRRPTVLSATSFPSSRQMHRIHPY